MCVRGAQEDYFDLFDKFTIAYRKFTQFSLLGYIEIILFCVSCSAKMVCAVQFKKNVYLLFFLVIIQSHHHLKVANPACQWKEYIDYKLGKCIQFNLENICTKSEIFSTKLRN
jgi:hypothetical protein